MKTYQVNIDEATIQAAASLGVKPAIHKSDPEYNAFLAQNGGKVGTACRVYFETGLARAVRIRDLVVKYQGAQVEAGVVSSPMSMLVFGARFGHVSRHLQRLFPNAKIIALGFEEPEMYFHQNDISMEASHAVADPSLAKAFFEFDVVVAPQFFCHVPKSQLSGWVNKYTDFMRKSALSISAFQGPLALSLRFPRRGGIFDKDGMSSPAQTRSSTPNGLDFAETFVKPQVVFDLLEKTRTRVIEYAEGSWDGVSDLFVARKLR